MFNRKLWPNVITASRIALLPVVLGAALAGSRGWFIGLLAVALATDALDGYLARRLDAYSDFGRRLDSGADYLALIAGLTGIAALWPEVFQRELPWVATGLGAFVAVLIYGFVRLGRAPCYHTWLAKTGALACIASLVPLLAGMTATPFHAAIVLQCLAGVDEMTIALLVPAHVGEMRSSWHAWRLRRATSGRPAAAAMPPAEPIVLSSEPAPVATEPAGSNGR